MNNAVAGSGRGERRPRDIVLATNNSHKAREFRRILSDASIELHTPRQVGVDFFYEEVGETFLANAMGKALELFRITRRPTMADDSGICVEALDGKPGVRSARFGAPDQKLDDAGRSRLLLETMRGIENRRAWYVCCVALIFSEERFFVAQETWEGAIAETMEGERGFGYDPLFYLPEIKMHAATILDEQKDRLSHRGKAIRSLLRAIS